MESETVPQRTATAGSGELKPIRTYQSDVEELMQRERVSKADIALAESKRRAATAPADAAPAEPKVFRLSHAIPVIDAPRRVTVNWRFVALGGGAVALLVGAGFAWRFLITQVYEMEETTEPPRQIEQASGDIILQGRESRAGFIKTVREKVEMFRIPLNEIRVLPIRIEERPVTTEELFSFLESRAPAPLVRALDAVPTVGIHGIRGNQLFLLFTVNSFDHAFDGMLAWEKTLLDELGPLFAVASPKTKLRGATTTEDILESRLIIKDTVIRNKDARAAFDRDGRIVFLYSFLDKQSLLITTNEETLRVVLPKVSKGALR